MSLYKKARYFVLPLFAAAALFVVTGCGSTPQTAAVAAPKIIPYGVAVNAVTNVYYVSNGPAGTISVMDGKTDNLTATIDVGMPVAGLAVNAATNTLYATARNLNMSGPESVYNVDKYNGDDPSVVVINTTLNLVTATLPNLGLPFGQLAVNSVTNKLFMTTDQGTGNYNIYTVDGILNKVTAQLQVEGNAAGLAINSKTNMVYVSTTSAALAIIDGRTNAIATAPNVSHDIGVAVDESSNTIYAISTDLNQVSVVSGVTNQLIAVIPVGTTPTSIAFDAASHKLYVGNAVSQTVTVIDTGSEKVLANVPVGEMPVQLAINPTANVVYVVLPSSIAKIDGTSNKLL